MAITRRGDDAAHLNALLQPRGRGFRLGGGYGAAGQHDLRALLATPHRQRCLHKPFWSVRRCWWWRSTGGWSCRRGHSCRRSNLRKRPLVADRLCGCCSSHGSGSLLRWRVCAGLWGPWWGAWETLLGLLSVTVRRGDAAACFVLGLCDVRRLLGSSRASERGGRSRCWLKGGRRSKAEPCATDSWRLVPATGWRPRLFTEARVLHRDVLQVPACHCFYVYRSGVRSRHRCQQTEC